MKFYASALLFDNDGVLVDSHAAAAKAWGQWCSEYAPEVIWDRPENHGVRAEDMVRKWIKRPELFDEANDRINQLEQDSSGETVPMHGAVELTRSLRPGTWTVVTSANINLGRARLIAAGHTVPAELVTAEDVSQGKPAPDPYLLGAKRLGFEPADCVVFEDAIGGVEAGLAAEVGLVVGVGEKALESQADIVVRDLTGITFDGEVLTIPDKNRLR